MLGLLPVASGAVIGIAAVSIGFGFVHGITLGFGVTLIGEAVDYAVYLFTQTAPGSSPQATLPRIWPTLRLGMLTSVCGFAAMLASSFTGFAQLGLFTIVGLIVAVAVTRFVLPGLLPPDFATATPARFAAVLQPVSRHAARLRVPVLCSVAAAILLLGLHGHSLWEDELSSLSPIPMADRMLDKQLRHDIGAPDARYLVVVNGSTQESALQASEALSAAMQTLVAEKALAGFESPSDYLPSQAMQRERQATLPDVDVLQTSLKEALAGLPFRPDLFDPFLKDVEAARSRPLLDRTSLEGTGLSLKLDSLLFQQKKGWDGDAIIAWSDGPRTLSSGPFSKMAASF